jgi:4'-phosphopantetheinyl transferase EntD
VVVGTTAAYLGIDVERLVPERTRIAPRILTPGELEELGPAPTWPDVLRCFCLKEATYKVLDDVAQQELRFRGLRLEDVKLSTSRVHRVTDGQCVARAAAALGTKVIVALAEPWIVGTE